MGERGGGQVIKITGTQVSHFSPQKKLRSKGREKKGARVVISHQCKMTELLFDDLARHFVKNEQVFFI